MDWQFRCSAHLGMRGLLLSGVLVAVAATASAPAEPPSAPEEPKRILAADLYHPPILERQLVAALGATDDSTLSRLAENPENLSAELGLADWRDPWGRPYRFRIVENALYDLPLSPRREIMIESEGADPGARGDDLRVLSVVLSTNEEPRPRAIGAPTGAVVGLVVDPEGHGLPGVTVKARSPSLQGERVTQTGADGHFALKFLPGGSYLLSAELEGFTTAVHPNVTVDAEARSELTIVLPLGNMSCTMRLTLSSG